MEEFKGRPRRSLFLRVIFGYESDLGRSLSSSALALSAFFVLLIPFFIVALNEFLTTRELTQILHENTCVVVNVTWFQTAFRYSIRWEVNVFLENRTDDLSVIPGEIEIRTMRPENAEDYADQMPIGYKGECFFGFKNDGDEVVTWYFPDLSYSLAATVTLSCVSGLLLLAIIWFSVVHCIRRSALELRKANAYQYSKLSSLQ